MGRITSMVTAVCAATLMTAAAASAQGIPSDRETVVTVSGPVSIPGATLPAGSYVFRIADSPSNRHIVQIFDRDRSKIITTLLAVPAERAELDGDPLITFKETPADRPPALRYWYYAGEKTGNEFVYPKAQAMAIARSSGESVSSIDTDATDIEGWKKSEVTRVTGNAEPPSSTTTSTTTSTATTTAPATQPEPTPPASTTAPVTTQPEPTQPPVTAAPATPAPAPEPAPMAAPVTSAPSTTAGQPEQPAGTSGREALPRTASELPTVGLAGLLALAGALAVRATRRSLA